MSKNMKTALVVDDETPDLEVLAEALAAAGYRVITVSDGKTAVESFQAHSEQIDLLVTDVAMSPMNGFDLAKLLVNRNPHLSVIFVSGYIGGLVFQYDDPPIPHFGFLRKPFTRAGLAAQIRQTLEEIATRTAA